MASRVWPGGVRDKKYRAIGAQEWVPPTLRLLGQDQMYGGPGEAPNYDWPNPIRPRRLPDYTLLSLPLLQTISAPPPPTPELNYDWPNPIPPRRLRDYTTLATGTGYLGQGRFYGGPGQVPSYDWQNALPRPTPRARDYTHLLGATARTIGGGGGGGGTLVASLALLRVGT